MLEVAAMAAVVGAWAAACKKLGYSTHRQAEVALLMSAAKDGRLSELTELLETDRVEIEARGEDGRTALAICAAEGHGSAGKPRNVGSNPALPSLPSSLVAN